MPCPSKNAQATSILDLTEAVRSLAVSPKAGSTRSLVIPQWVSEREGVYKKLDSLKPRGVGENLTPSSAATPWRPPAWRQSAMSAPMLRGSWPVATEKLAMFLFCGYSSAFRLPLG